MKTYIVVWQLDGPVMFTQLDLEADHDVSGFESWHWVSMAYDAEFSGGGEPNLFLPRDAVDAHPSYELIGVLLGPITWVHG